MVKNAVYTRYRILILLVAFNSYSTTIMAQKADNGITFCFDKEQKVITCSVEDNYVLKFENLRLKYLYNQDSSIFYDVYNKSFKIYTGLRNVILVKLQEDGTVTIKDTTDKVYYIRPFLSKNVNCGRTPNYFETYDIDTTYISFTYLNCKMDNVFLGDLHIGSINMKIYKCTNTDFFSWDISISPVPISDTEIKKSIKILTNKNTGQPNYIGICDRIKMQIYDKDTGIEMVSFNKDNFFNLIRTVDTTPVKNVFLYSDLITYKKNSKLKKTRLKITTCN